MIEFQTKFNKLPNDSLEMNNIPEMKPVFVKLKRLSKEEIDRMTGV